MTSFLALRASVVRICFEPGWAEEAEEMMAALAAADLLVEVEAIFGGDG